MKKILFTEIHFTLLLCAIAIVGEVFSFGVLIWLWLTNLYGFWFWFSCVSCFGWGLFVAAMNDLMKLESEG